MEDVRGVVQGDEAAWTQRGLDRLDATPRTVMENAELLLGSFGDGEKLDRCDCDLETSGGRPRPCGVLY